MMVSKDGEAGLVRFPLIDDVPLMRQQAIKVVRDIGWPDPPRSACWMCPNQTNKEWRNLKIQYPAEFHKAVELEREIRLREPDAFFTGYRIPLDEVDFGNEEDLFGHGCNSGMCFT